MAPGDIYATNDPWIGAGHLNDLLLVAPIFDGERPVALTACVSHLYDLGGLGMGPDGSDVLDEGLFIPPLKLVDRGQVSQMFLDLLKANSRSPDSNEGDLYALMACCDTGARRLVEMMHEFALTDLDQLAGHILTTSKRGAEAAIADLPAGHLRKRHGARRLRLRSHPQGDDDRFGHGRSSPTSPARRRPRPTASTFPSTTRRPTAPSASAASSARRSPTTRARWNPSSSRRPRDSILNAQYPAPVAARHAVGQMTSDLLLGCLHAALPGRVPAEGASCLWDLPLRSAAMARCRRQRNPLRGGVHPLRRHRRPADVRRPVGDGLPERRLGHPGRDRREHRAGADPPPGADPGQRRTGTLSRRPGTGASNWKAARARRSRSSARSSAPSIRRAAGTAARTARSGASTLSCGKALAGKGEQTIPAGERLIFETPGGGGYGDPLARLPEQVGRDVRLGLVSRDEAQRAYGVVVGTDGEVDETATQEARRSMGTLRFGGRTPRKA